MRNYEFLFKACEFKILFIVIAQRRIFTNNPNFNLRTSKHLQI